MTTVGGSNYNGLLVATNSQGLVDYSLIDMTNTGGTVAYKNKLVKTGSDGKLNINLLPTSTSGSANKVPITTGTTLSNSWLDNTDGTTNTGINKVVITGSDSLISNTLLNATDGSTSTTSNNKEKVVKTGSTGQINYNLIKMTSVGGSSTYGNTLVKLSSDGKLAASLFRDDMFLPLTGGVLTGNVIINNGTTTDHQSVKNLTQLATTRPNLSGIVGTSYNDGYYFGTNGSKSSNNYLEIGAFDSWNSSSSGRMPIKVTQYQSSDVLNSLTQKNQITLMDKDGYTTVKKLTSSGDITTTDTTTTSGNLVINGTGSSSIAGTLTVKKGLIVDVTGGDKVFGDRAASSTSPTPLIIGKSTGLHLEIDENEIMAKTSASTVAGVNEASTVNNALFLQADGGLVKIGNNAKTNLHVNGNISTMNYNSDPGNKEASAGNLYIVGTSNLSGATTIGSTLGVSGNTTVGGTLGVTGNTTVGGTLGVTGATTIGNSSSKSNLTVHGAIEAKNGINVTGGNIDITTNSTSTSGIASYVMGHMAASDDWRIAGGSTASDAGYLELAVADNGSENIYVRKYKFNPSSSGQHFHSVYQELTLLDGSGNTNLPGSLTLKNADGNVNGTITALRANFTSDKDARGSSFNNPALTIGPDTGVHLEIDQNEIQGKSSKTTTGNISLNADGGNVYIADNSGASGSLSVPNGNISTGGNLTVDNNTTLKGTLSVTNSTTLSDTLSVSKATTIGGLLTANGHITIPNGGNVVSDSYNNPHLTLGPSTGVHIEIDNNEIAAKKTASTAGTLYLQDGGGTVQVGGEAIANLTVRGNVLIDKGKTLNMCADGGSERTVLRIARTGDHNGAGDDILLTGGGNMTAIFSGDAYSDWYSYIHNNSAATIKSEGLWQVTHVDADNKDYVLGYGDGLGGYSDSLYLMADHSVIIDTNIQGSNGYRNRKRFTFDTSGNLTVPGIIKMMNGTTTSTSLAPKPTTSAGVGQVGTIHCTTESRNFTFPSGGTYWYFYIRATSGWWWDVTQPSTGIAAGGDTITLSGNRLEGFYVRIT